MALERLVDDVDGFTEAWEHRPVVSRGLDAFDDVFGVDDADQVLDRGLRLPYVRLIKEGVELDPAEFSRPLAPGRTEDALVRADVVRERVADGVTLAIANLEQYHPPLAAYCRDLSREFGADMHAGIYVTSPAARGAGPHYDVMSVFIRQLAGRKRWQVREPADPLPTRPWEPGMRWETPVVLETWLEPGDCLYVPRGFIHDGWTDDGDGSVHLTFCGKKPVMWQDVLRSLVRQLTAGEEFRQALPMGFVDHPADLVDELATRVATLRDELAGADLAAFTERVARRCQPETLTRRDTPPLAGVVRQRVGV